jgi:prepilin-type N-terminal cleavage/methylation domain-containing protein
MITKDYYIKNKKGFSLIELLVVITILGIAILGLVTFFSGGTRSWIAGQSQLTAQRNARQAMDRMVRELRHSDGLIISQDDKVKVSIPDLTGAGGPGYHVTYYLKNGDSVYRKKEIGAGGSTDNILIDDVLNLEFDYPESFRIDILLEIDVDHDGHADISLNTEVNLRNFGL